MNPFIDINNVREHEVPLTGIIPTFNDISFHANGEPDLAEVANADLRNIRYETCGKFIITAFPC